MSTPDKKSLLENMDFETKNNFVGFYNLLFQIDKRNNPKKYQIKNVNKIKKRKC